MRTRVVILGAGFAGLELSSRLSAELADRVDVTLIDQSDSFLFGFSKLDVMFARRTMDEVRIPHRTITKPGLTFRHESVRSIDPARKQVVTNADVYDADLLVVALGADLDPGATPGLDECGYEFYSPEGAAQVRDLLPAFAGGNVVIAVLGAFFKCPPAPYETAVLLHEHLSRRGVRDVTTIHLVTPMPEPIPRRTRPCANSSSAPISIAISVGWRLYGLNTPGAIFSLRRAAREPSRSSVISISA